MVENHSCQLRRFTVVPSAVLTPGGWATHRRLPVVKTADGEPADRVVRRRRLFLPQRGRRSEGSDAMACLGMQGRSERHGRWRRAPGRRAKFSVEVGSCGYQGRGCLSEAEIGCLLPANPGTDALGEL
jgi:hypothetical protein